MNIWRGFKIWDVLVGGLESHTGCVEGFFEAEKGIKNAIGSENSISKLCASKSVI